MRRLVGGAAVAAGLAAIGGTALFGATHVGGRAPERVPSCSVASGWCVTLTRLPSGLRTWEVTCGPATAGSVASGCPPVDVRVVGPIAPVDEIGVGLPALPAGSRVLPADAGGGNVNCVGAEWCIVGGEAFVAAPSAPVGVTTNYVAPEIYCDPSCTDGGWKLELLGEAHGQRWMLRVALPPSLSSGAAG